MGEHRIGSVGADEVVADDGLVNDAKPRTILDGLKSALAAQVELKTLTLTVPMRPEIKLVFTPNFDFEEYDAWVKKATDKKNNIDYMRIARTVIARTNTQILFQDEVAKTQQGEELTITHGDIHNMLGVAVGGTGQAIKKLYVSDGHAIQAMRQVVEAAGFSVEGDVLQVDDDDNPLVS